MQELFSCKEVELFSWLKEYIVRRVENKIPIISIVEKIIEINETVSFNNKFLSDKTQVP